MPYRQEYIEPETAFEVTTPEDVTWTIYHTYGGNDIDSRRTFWYTTDIEEDEHFEFDIRDIQFDIPEFKELYISSTTTMERYAPDKYRRILQLALNTGAVHFDPDGLLVIGGASCRAHA